MPACPREHQDSSHALRCPVGLWLLTSHRGTGSLGHPSTLGLSFEMGGPGLVMNCFWTCLASSLAGAFYLELGLGLVD